MDETVDDDTRVPRAGSGSLGRLAVRVAAFGVEFEVREPPEPLTARTHRAA
ncbi:hypothetical protein GCM10022252_60680 [Streptosporangium oxazolinicum]|uniref:Uncharacterized protein n=1 Tax=Streptosporangium oxazolinicum TaxID=909287 RepID=A0ABP8BC04_9ACTN